MSQRTPIKLNNGPTVGYIETCSDGKLKGFVNNGPMVGIYDPKADITKKTNGPTVKGNMLPQLIMEACQKKAA